tara:strand:+ start:742 stop:1227 length:486 start_codon:yes stop_codon:yes gene_type:complete
MGSTNILEINEFELDKEWIQQPSTYHKYATKLAEAKHRLEESKAQTELVKAELSSEIRNNPNEFGIAKITETVVASTILTQDEFKSVQAELFDQKHQVDLLQAVVTSLDHRKRALESLVSLHGQDYFSSPRADTRSQETIDEIQKKSVRRKASKNLSERIK